MAGFSISTTIAAPVEHVFALATDLDGWAGRIKGITKVEKLTPGPVGVGTRFRETRVMFGKPATEEMAFTAFEPNHSYSLGCESCGASYSSTFTFQSAGHRTIVTLEFTWRARSFFAWLLMPLGWLMKGMLKKCIRKDLDDLKAAAEGEQQHA